MAKVVNIHEAKTHFSRLVEEVQRGEEVVIAKRGKPVARLIPEVAPAPLPRIGRARGRIWIGPDFDDPIEDIFEVLKDDSPVERTDE